MNDIVIVQVWTDLYCNIMGIFKIYFLIITQNEAVHQHAVINLNQKIIIFICVLLRSADIFIMTNKDQTTRSCLRNVFLFVSVYSLELIHVILYMDLDSLYHTWVKCNQIVYVFLCVKANALMISLSLSLSLYIYIYI